MVHQDEGLIHAPSWVHRMKPHTSDLRGSDMTESVSASCYTAVLRP